MAVNKKSNLLECIFISKKSLEISLNLTSQIKQLSLTHFVLIVTEPNLETRSFYSEYRGILALPSNCNVFGLPSFEGPSRQADFVLPPHDVGVFRPKLTASCVTTQLS